MLANEGSLTQEYGEWIHHGDAMDVAFLAMGYKLGISSEEVKSENHLLGIIPYELENQFSGAFFKKDGITFIVIKGAVEKILKFCHRMQMSDKTVEIDILKIEKQAEELAAEGYRVLAVAGAKHQKFEKKDKYEDKDLPKMVFQGFVGFIDPLRPEVIDSVNKCKAAGIKVIMIT